MHQTIFCLPANANHFEFWMHFRRVVAYCICIAIFKHIYSLSVPLFCLLLFCLPLSLSFRAAFEPIIRMAWSTTRFIQRLFGSLVGTHYNIINPFKYRKWNHRNWIELHFRDEKEIVKKNSRKLKDPSNYIIVM